MAEGGEKTEMPTPKKLRDARQKGQVCNSKDCVSTAILLVLLSILGALGIALTDDLSNLLRFIGLRVGENDVFALREAGKIALSRKECLPRVFHRSPEEEASAKSAAEVADWMKANAERNAHVGSLAGAFDKLSLG